MKLFHPSFIEIYDHALTDEQCDYLIDAFESDRTAKSPGFHLKNGELSTDETYKKDIELDRSLFSESTYISNVITPVLFEHIDKYVNKFPMCAKAGPFVLTDVYNFQKYVDETDGFKDWHCEHGPDESTSIRVLVWMFYLNNAKSGTDFTDYGRIKAKKGRLVIWPAGFTHTHRSQLPNQGLKYIITGWTQYM